MYLQRYRSLFVLNENNIIEQFNNFISSAPDYILAGLSDADTITARNAKCQSCEHLDLGAQRCTLCGCYVWAKMRAAAATCPDNRWPGAI